MKAAANEVSRTSKQTCAGEEHEKELLAESESSIICILSMMICMCHTYAVCVGTLLHVANHLRGYMHSRGGYDAFTPFRTK